jgi:uncharacterized protein YeaO (DUF488 family)
MILHKSIYDPPSADDGFRVLVMRIVRDPAILSTHAYDIWMRSLGPTSASLRNWWAGTIDDDAFYQEYRRDVSRAALRRLRALERKHGTITVLCRETFPETCHRYELVKLYEELYPRPVGG